MGSQEWSQSGVDTHGARYKDGSFSPKDGLKMDTLSDLPAQAQGASLKRESHTPLPTVSKRRKVGDKSPRIDVDDGEIQDDETSNLPSAEKKRLACPFFQRKPTRTKPSCVYPGFSSIARLKEHLYRQHMQPPHRCTRCMARFNSDAQLRDHLRAEVPCKVNLDVSPEGITTEQEKALKSKKRSARSATANGDTDKWNEIYGILFPNEKIPSAYCDPITAPSSCEGMLKQELPFCLKETLDPLLSSCEAYNQIPVIEIVAECLDKVLSGWQRGVGDQQCSDELPPTSTEMDSKDHDMGSPPGYDIHMQPTKVPSIELEAPAMKISKQDTRTVGLSTQQHQHQRESDLESRFKPEDNFISLD